MQFAQLEALKHLNYKIYFLFREGLFFLSSRHLLKKLDNFTYSELLTDQNVVFISFDGRLGIPSPKNGLVTFKRLSLVFMETLRGKGPYFNKTMDVNPQSWVDSKSRIINEFSKFLLRFSTGDTFTSAELVDAVAGTLLFNKDNVGILEFTKKLLDLAIKLKMVKYIDEDSVTLENLTQFGLNESCTIIHHKMIYFGQNYLSELEEVSEYLATNGNISYKMSVTPYLSIWEYMVQNLPNKYGIFQTFNFFKPILFTFENQNYCLTGNLIKYETYELDEVNLNSFYHIRTLNSKSQFKLLGFQLKEKLIDVSKPRDERVGSTLIVTNKNAGYLETINESGKVKDLSKVNLDLIYTIFTTRVIVSGGIHEMIYIPYPLIQNLLQFVIEFEIPNQISDEKGNSSLVIDPLSPMNNLFQLLRLTKDNTLSFEEIEKDFGYTKENLKLFSSLFNFFLITDTGIKLWVF
jgi:hypothetical protein